MRKLERQVYMEVLDQLWMQHLENMQHLREGIHWRGVGQRDPLVEYRVESQKLFEGLQATLREEVLKILTHIRPSDVTVQIEEDHETELTRLAEGSVEKGVNEVSNVTHLGDDDFDGSVQKAQTVSDANRAKNEARKKKKLSAKTVKESKIVGQNR